MMFAMSWMTRWQQVLPAMLGGFCLCAAVWSANAADPVSGRNAVKASAQPGLETLEALDALDQAVLGGTAVPSPLVDRRSGKRSSRPAPVNRAVPRKASQPSGSQHPAAPRQETSRDTTASPERWASPKRPEERQRVQNLDFESTDPREVLHTAGGNASTGVATKDGGEVVQDLSRYDYAGAKMDLPPLPDVGPRAPQFGEPLALDDVLTSVETTFPLLIAALQERGVADGELVSALGAFDLSITGSALQTPAGYYDNYRADLKLEQQTAASGAKVFGGYKWGRGHFPEWFGDRQTYDGGAFQGGILLPLLKGAPIDKKRADLYKARISRQQAEPTIQRARIEYVRNASRAYWDWVAASQSVQIGENLLEIAVERDALIAKQIELGQIVPIERIDNRRVLTTRQAKLIDFRRKSQATAIKLSLYYRDETGTPLLARIDQAPASFPEFDEPDAALLIEEGLSVAVNNRPEILHIQLARQRLGVDLDTARNSLLPEVDAVAQATQNMGGPTDKFDKSQTTVEAGVTFDVPLQRRKARGEVQKSTAAIARLGQQLEYARNSVTVEVQEAVTNLVASYQQVDRTRESVFLAERMEQAERVRFSLGQGTTTILVVNLREIATADARLMLVDETTEFFRAWADYRAAVGMGNTDE